MRTIATCTGIAVFALAPSVAEATTSRTIIRYAKSGGIAGVRDTLRVRADGVAFATSGRGSRAVRARLTPKRLARLRSVLAAAHLETLRPNYPAPGAADTFIYSVSYRGHTVSADQTKMPSRLRKPVALLEKTFGEVAGANQRRFVDAEHAALARARARWKRAHMRDYRFRLRVSCFCPGRGEAHTITVRDGRARGANEAGKLVDTVPKMFRRIAKALDDPRAGEVSVRYDAERGYPRRVSIDQIKNAIDDELSWTVDRLRAA